METGNPVSSRMRLSRFFNSAPAAGQHDAAVADVGRKARAGCASSATRIAFMMVETHSLRASRISLSSTVMVLGHAFDQVCGP